MHRIDESASALSWGRAVHCLLFEPDDFPARYCEYDGRRAGKAWDEFASANSGREILRSDGPYGYASALAAARSFVGDLHVQQLIAAGQGEVSVFTVASGMQAKCRLDWVSSSARAIVDLKTTRDISPRAFGRQFFTLGYDIKLGLQRLWWGELHGGELLPVYVIAIENKPPYDVAVIPIPDAVLDQGGERGQDIIRRVGECIDSGEWPGVAGGEYLPLDVPAWEMDDTEIDWDEVAA